MTDMTNEVQAKKYNWWIPEPRQMYYYIESTGRITYAIYYISEPDVHHARFALGNVFSEAQSAKEMLDSGCIVNTFEKWHNKSVPQS